MLKFIPVRGRKCSTMSQSRKPRVEIYPREGTEMPPADFVFAKLMLKFIPVRGRKCESAVAENGYNPLKFIPVRGRKFFLLLVLALQ